MHGFSHGALAVCVYFLLAASCALLARRLIRIPDELFRKTLHFILLGSLLVFVFAFSAWWQAALTALAFAAVVYPLLRLAGRIPGFSHFTTERRPGELCRSLLLVFSMFALVIGVCWGWLNERYFVLASVYAWGVGDAFAALIGKRFGRRKFAWRRADPHKSVEGSLAMFLTSATAVLAVLLCRGGLKPAVCVLLALACALAATVAELVTTDGNDTVTCPLAAMATLLPLCALLGVLG